MNDRFNPIFIYEIRQVVRNRMVLTAMCVYLMLLVGVVGEHFYALMQSGRTFGYDNVDGPVLAHKLLGLLGFYSFGVTTAYSVAMTIRQGFEEELIYVTRLDWYRTACGKAQVAMLLMALFYAVTMPMLTLAWVMRGVDLFQLVIFLAVLFSVTQCLNYYITAAVVRCSNGVDIVAAAAGLILAGPPLLFVYSFLYHMCDAVVRSGSGVILLSAKGDFIRFVLIMLVPIGFTIAFSGEMFMTNWKRRTVMRRFAKAGAYIWFSVLLSTMFGGFLGIVLSVVFGGIRLLLGI